MHILMPINIGFVNHNQSFLHLASFTDAITASVSVLQLKQNFLTQAMSI